MRTTPTRSPTLSLSRYNRVRQKKAGSCEGCRHSAVGILVHIRVGIEYCTLRHPPPITRLYFDTIGREFFSEALVTDEGCSLNLRSRGNNSVRYKLRYGALIDYLVAAAAKSDSPGSETLTIQLFLGHLHFSISNGEDHNREYTKSGQRTVGRTTFIHYIHITFLSVVVAVSSILINSSLNRRGGLAIRIG